MLQGSEGRERERRGKGGVDWVSAEEELGVGLGQVSRR
jgi:hypothetical protein